MLFLGVNPENELAHKITNFVIEIHIKDLNLKLNLYCHNVPIYVCYHISKQF